MHFLLSLRDFVAKSIFVKKLWITLQTHMPNGETLLENTFL